MNLPRRLARRLARLVEVFPVVVLSGARQVGKTTLARQILAGWDLVTLDPDMDVQNARAEPDLFLANHPGPLVVDEVQFAPPLVAAIKRAVDMDRRPGRFVLTGSQQWNVLRSISESLAGRAVFLDLLSFDLGERAGVGDGASWLAAWLAEEEELRRGPIRRLALQQMPWEILWRGQLPDATRLPLDVVPAFHAAYRRTYIERDVRMVADVSDLQAFGHFVRLAGALTSQEVNASQLGRDLGMTPQTARRWLDVLLATFQWFELPAWSGNTVKRVSGRPKGFLTDTGTVCSAQLISAPAVLGGHPMLGALLETAVLHEIRSHLAAMSTGGALYHWRTHGGAEVDLVIERDGRLFPVEVKATAHPSRRDASGIKAFRETFGAQVGPGLVLAPCAARVQITEDTWALPWDVTM